MFRYLGYKSDTLLKVLWFSPVSKLWTLMHVREVGTLETIEFQSVLTVEALNAYHEIQEV